MTTFIISKVLVTLSFLTVIFHAVAQLIFVMIGFVSIQNTERGGTGSKINHRIQKQDQSHQDVEEQNKDFKMAGSRSKQRRSEFELASGAQGSNGAGGSMEPGIRSRS